MKIKRSLYLSEELTSQYPIEKYKKLILDVIDIVENFIIELGDESKYDSSSTAKYDEVIGTHQFSTNSKIESMLIKMYDQEPKKREFIDKYFKVLKSLDKLERKAFICTFIKGMETDDLIEVLKLSDKPVRRIKKSAIVRFSIRLGLDKFI